MKTELMRRMRRVGWRRARSNPTSTWKAEKCKITKGQVYIGSRQVSVHCEVKEAQRTQSPTFQPDPELMSLHFVRLSRESN